MHDIIAHLKGIRRHVVPPDRRDAGGGQIGASPINRELTRDGRGTRWRRPTSSGKRLTRTTPMSQFAAAGERILLMNRHSFNAITADKLDLDRRVVLHYTFWQWMQ